MKKLGFAILILFSIQGSAFAGCLDAIANVTTVSSNIHGFYINSGEGTQYVILDKATCVAAGSSAKLGLSTKSNYYLYFDAGDKALLSSLYMAYSKGDKVDFRVVGEDAYGYNKLAYVVIPSNANSQ
ncbi:MAG: hypothetical protein OEZ43_19620 [Gammaproteobacteria bacterium]|nr:hypothetical protein [Gammaproteobacteria bacterium]